MLSFERKAVRSLIGTSDSSRRAAIEEYVDGSLRSMPDHLRLGLTVGSVVLGAWDGVAGLAGGGSDEARARRLERWEASPIGPVNQYVRLLRSLVLFAEHEMAPAA
jgi:hypothetical protein